MTAEDRLAALEASMTHVLQFIHDFRHNMADVVPDCPPECPMPENGDGSQERQDSHQHSA